MATDRADLCLHYQASVLYGLVDGYSYTLEEVGKIFSVTRERVRQIESKAVRKLQHPVRARKLTGFLDGKIDLAAGERSLS